MRRRSGLKILWQLLGLMRGLWIYMVIAIVFGVLGHCMAILIPVSGAGLILFEKHEFLWVLVLSGIFRGVFRYIEQLFNHELAFRVLAKIRDVVFGKLRSLAPAKLETKNRGNLISLITSDVEHLEVFYAHTISPVFIALIVNGFILIIMFKIKLIFGLISLFSYLFVGLFIPVYYSKKGRNQGLSYRNQLGSLNSYVLESVIGLEDVLQFRMEQSRFEKMHEMNMSLNKSQEKMTQLGVVNQAIGELVVMGSILLFLLVGFHFKLNRQIVLFAMVIHASSFGPVLALSSLANNMYHTLASGERTLNLLEETPEVFDIVDGNEMHFTDLDIENVKFKYGDMVILDDVSLSLSGEEVIAIKGESGSGKSTLLKLIMRFWDVDSGSISFSSKNIKTIKTEELRKMPGVIMQTTDLFEDTIYNNITLGHDFTEEEVRLACEKAGIHKFICGLEDGYQTNLLEFGASVSSGERQRIGLARIFLHNNELILLDEPTSNLDSLNEAIILNSLIKFRGKRPIIITSHRLSTLKIADRVLELENGALQD